MLADKKAISYVNILLGALFITICAVIVLTLNRGFDFTDEGGFLLSYENIEIYRGGIYNYHIIINKLTNWLDPGIIEYRWMSFVITFLSSFILAFGFHKWIKFNFKQPFFFKNFLFLFFFLSIGNFLFYFPGLHTIYNNTLTNFFLQGSTGLLFFVLAKEPVQLIKSGKRLLILSLIGVLCAFSFFVKFPTGVLQVFSYFTILFFYFSNQSLKRRFILPIWFLLGVLLGILIYFISFQSPSEWYFHFRKEYKMLSDHSSGLILKNYLFEIYTLVKFCIKNFVWLITIPAWIIIKQHFHLFLDSKTVKWIEGLLILLLGAFFIFELYYLEFYRSAFLNWPWRNAYFYIIIICLQLAIIFAAIYPKVFSHLKKIKLNYNISLIILLMLATPFIGAFGTANPIFLNSLGHAAPWFVVIIIFSIFLFQYFNKKLVLLFFVLIPSLVTTSQIIDGNLFMPYYSIFNKNKSNFFDQTEKVDEIELLEGVYVDAQTKEFLIDLNHIFEENDYRKGYPVFGFHMPGVIYLLEGVSPGVPYYFNKDRDINAIKGAEIENQPPVIMVTKESPINPALLKTMREKGIIFPEDYLLQGEVYFPNSDSILKVYFPKSF